MVVGRKVCESVCSLHVAERCEGGGSGFTCLLFIADVPERSCLNSQEGGCAGAATPDSQRSQCGCMRFMQRFTQRVCILLVPSVCW